jgi:N-acetylglucosamine kinase-like BadF-type ATPase
VAILIADSGSTKATWQFKSHTDEFQFQTRGFNPYFLSGENLAASLKEEVMDRLKEKIPDRVFFYGAGCGAAGQKEIIQFGLKKIYPASAIEVNDDLLGAARGLLGRQEGLICILGTGMNNGWFDGEKITTQVDSLGFILGDEGSGTAIGKRLLMAFLRKEMPGPLRENFDRRYAITRDDIIRSIYAGTEVARFIAGFTRFAADHLHEPFIIQLIERVFTEFFEKIISKYSDRSSITFNCAGSVGYYFSEILQGVARNFGLNAGKVVQSPIAGLVDFHRQ